MDLRRKPCVNAFFPEDANDLAEFRFGSSGSANASAGSSSGNNDDRPVVLQITAIGNYSQPSTRRFDDTTPRMLSIHLTDGHTKVIIRIAYV